MIIGPSIKTDGLLLHLDAGSYKSYPRTGFTWYDISGNDHHAYGQPGTSVVTGSLDANFPTWQANDGGRFYLDGTDAWTILTDLGSHTDVTVESFFYLDTSGGQAYFADARNGSGTYYFWNYNSHNISIGNTYTADSPETYQEASNWFNRWVHFVIIDNPGYAPKLYIDGVLIVAPELKGTTSIDNDFGQYFRIGSRYTNSNEWEGYFGNFRIYNVSLTATEVLQNFNAQRNRFGI